MRKYLYIVSSLLFLFGISCNAQKSTQVEPTKYIETGVDSEAWVKIPAGEFLKGQHRHATMIENDYEIMVTDVTNAQYARFLTEALAKGTIKIIDNKVLGFYKGDPFDGYKHEFEIPAGDKVFMNLVEPGMRI